MGIQRKIAFTYFISFFVLLVAGYYFFSLMMFKDINTLERELSRQKLDSGYGLMQNEARRIQRTLRDYSCWSQSCEFINKPNDEYRKENLQADVLGSLDISFICFLNTEGQWVEGIYYDDRNKQLTDFPDELKMFITMNKRKWLSLRKDDYIAGFCQISGNVNIITASPVTREKREGPIAGYMFMGQKLSIQKMKDFSAILEMEMYVVPAKKGTYDANNVYGFVRSDEKIIVSRPLIDIFNRPINLLEISINRDVFAFATKANHQFLFWYILSSLIIFAVIVIVFEMLVIRPIKKANQQLSIALFNNAPNAAKTAFPAKEGQIIDLINKTSLTAEMLRSSADTNRQLIEETPVGIVILDETQKIFDINKKALNICGYDSPDELRGKEGSFLFYSNRYTQNNQEKNTDSIASYLKKRNGDIIPVLATKTSLMINGRSMNFVGFSDQSEKMEAQTTADDYKRRFEDISDEFYRIDQALKNEINQHRETQEALIKARQESQVFNRLKYALLANLSHEIKTPLNALIGFADMIKDESLPVDILRQNLGSISRSASQLQDVINEIIDLSRLESGEVKPAYEIIKVKSIITEIYNQWNNNSNPNITMELRLPAGNDEMTIAIDREWFLKIWNHLLNNAFKFTESGRIEIGYRMDQNSPCFFVADTGIGMIENVKKSVFEMFFQAEDSSHRHHGGIGLGLPIVRKAVKLMNGEISLESSPEKGTIISFKLNCTTDMAKSGNFVI